MLRDGTRHIADQSQFVSQDMSLIPLMHHPYSLFDAILSLSIENTSQRGAQLSVNLFIQIIDPSGKLSQILLFICHLKSPSLPEK